MRSLFVMLFLFRVTVIICQVDEDKSWCRINCDPALHTENTGLIYEQIYYDSIVQSAEKYAPLHFPLRFVFVTEKDTLISAKLKDEVAEVVSDLNYAFRNTQTEFSLYSAESLQSSLKIEDLSANRFDAYDKFSHQYDLDSLITVYVLDHKHDFCRVNGGSISCSRTGGFSYILSGLTNNIVISTFDLRNSKIVAHEFGHFFGLFHTFEEQTFGKDSFAPQDCSTRGDLICDTPPDPGAVFEIYVNYATCEMQGFTDAQGNAYKPLLQNYMSYYKPCYLRENLFTKQQELVIKLASRLGIRKRLSR